MFRKPVAWIIVFVVGLYLAGPAIASVLRVGYRDGPVIYPREFHSIVYIMFHDETIDGKPRISFTSILYNRPLFYGLPRRPKPERERVAIFNRFLDFKISGNSLGYDKLVAENNRIEARR